MTIKRMTFLQELLAFVGLKDRLHLVWISSTEAYRFVQVVTEFTEKVRIMGPCRFTLKRSGFEGERLVSSHAVV